MACDIAGSQTALSKILNVSVAFINQLVLGKRPVPVRLCLLIEGATGVSKKLLRPHDWKEYWPE